MSNTPDFKNSEFLTHETQVQTVNDFFNGIDTAKNYIKKFSMEDDTDFNNRVSESHLTNFVKDTVDTTKNIIFRKPLDLTNISNNNVLEWCEKINFKDNINDFAKKILTNRKRDGFTFILVDSPSYNPDEITTLSEQEQNNIRPYFSNILRSQVINWELNDFNEYTRFSIKESYSERVGLYGLEYKEQIRMFEIVDRNVEVSIWREGKEVSRDRLALNVIPIVKIGNDLVPPLYDQARINIAHINRNSEKANYVKIGASPFPLIWGDEDDNKQKTLGINSGIRFTGTKQESGFEWAELKGNNHDVISKEIEYLEKQMERITLEFVSELKNATATEVEKASTSNESKLVDYATELEMGINYALELMNAYVTSDLGENFIIVNKDFDSNILESNQINQLIQLRTSGNLSWDELRLALERGEVLRILDDKERETEKLLLRDDGLIE